MRIAVWALFAFVVASRPESHAQGKTPSHPARIGFVSGSEESVIRALGPWKALTAGLADEGMIEGRDYTFEFRSFTGGHIEQFEPLTRDLLKAGVDLLLVAVCGAPIDAARRATQTIPIVVATCNDDLVELGIIKSFNHPGGNITGLSKLTPDLAPKRLELLLQAVPNAKRIAVLWNPGYSDFKADWRELRRAAKELGVTLLPVEFLRGDDLADVFDVVARQRPDALIMFSDVVAYNRADRIGRLARERRLPAMFAFREVPDAGGLMSYGPNITDMWHQAAKHIARILKGAKAGDLPIEQPTRFELVINRKSASDFGIKLPPTLLLQADALVD